MKQQPQTKAEADRNAKIVQRALEIMAQGHYGWSWALEQARKQVKP